MKSLIVFFVAMTTLTACNVGITTRSACQLHREAFCSLNMEAAECVKEPRLSQQTIDTLERDLKEKLTAFKLWVRNNCA